MVRYRNLGADLHKFKAALQMQIRMEAPTLIWQKPLRATVRCVNNVCGCRWSNYLWISHDLKVIWAEVPKAGSSFIKSRFDIMSKTISFQTGAEAYRLAQSGVIESRHVSERGIFSLVGRKAFDRWGRGRAFFAPQDEIERFASGQDESLPQGRYGFRHSFASLRSLTARHPSYRVLLVWRNPLDRFVSTTNMFFGGGDDNRDRQRVQIGYLELGRYRSLSEFATHLRRSPNCHFNATGAFHDISEVRALARRNSLVALGDLERCLDDLLGVASPTSLPDRNATRKVVLPAGNLDYGVLEVIDERFSLDRHIQSEVA